jgi:chaperonin GroES
MAFVTPDRHADDNAVKATPIFGPIHRNRPTGGSMNIRPLHDRLIVKREAEERKSPGGIVIPDTAAEKPTFGKVISVGKGKILENGEVRAPDVKAGDKILFGKYAGTEVKVNGEEFVVMREEDVMAVVEAS